MKHFFFCIISISFFSCSSGHQYTKYEKIPIPENQVALYFYTIPKQVNTSCGTFYFQKFRNNVNSGINYSFTNCMLDGRFCNFICDKDQYSFIIKFSEQQTINKVYYSSSENIVLDLTNEKSQYIFIKYKVSGLQIFTERMDNITGENEIKNCVQ